ncbi:MAG: hypothetical protein MUO73_03050 [Thermoplasmata archaeon]|nr:hypothetical protein [Thermoplasmata archaeon]
MDEKLCPYETKRKTESKTLIINCRACTRGNSTLCDEPCRRSIIQILQKEPGVDRLVLNHAFVKVFTGEELRLLNDITRFVESLESYGHLRLYQKEYDRCKTCTEKRQKELQTCIQRSTSDPVEVFFQLKELLQKNQSSESSC